MTMGTDEIAIRLNGKDVPVSVETTIDAFLATRELQGKLVVVEVNGVIVPRSDFASRVFLAGDTVEVVHFVGGG